MNRKMGDISDVATRAQPRRAARLGSHAHQQVDSRDAQRVEEGDVEVVRLAPARSR